MVAIMTQAQPLELDAPSLSRIERRRVNGRQEVRVRRLTGLDRREGGVSRRLLEQCRHALVTGAHMLEAAGLSMNDVVRVVYVLHDAEAFPTCFPLLRDAFGDARPALTLRVVNGFDMPDVKIELELVARGRILA